MSIELLWAPYPIIKDLCLCVTNNSKSTEQYYIVLRTKCVVPRTMSEILRTTSIKCVVLETDKMVVLRTIGIVLGPTTTSVIVLRTTVTGT